MTVDNNREDLVNLRNRVNKLEEELAKAQVRMSVLTTLIALVVPSVITILPHFLS